MATHVLFSPGSLIDHGYQRVFTRENWLNPWVEQTHWHCLEAVWSTAPSMPVATIQDLYGWISHEDESGFSWNQKDGASLVGHFVKVVFTETSTVPIASPWTAEFSGEFGGGGSGLPMREWYGIIRMVNDQQLGAEVNAGLSIPTGREVYTAYGLESLLAERIIDTAFIDDGEGGAVQIDVPPVFNYRGQPNRSPTKILGAYVFANESATANYWSSKDIVEYLIVYQRAASLVNNPAWAYNPINNVAPDWDQPELSQQGIAVYSLIEQLLSRRRLMTWWTETDGTTIDLYSDTFVQTNLSIPLAGATDLPANRTQVHLDFDRDQMTTATRRISEIQKVDQVVVRGERMRCVGTLPITQTTGPLVEGWSTEHAGLYRDAAAITDGMPTPGYAGLNRQDKQRRNAEVRNRSELDLVYSYFKIVDDWDFKAGYPSPTEPMFPDVDSGGMVLPDPLPVFRPGLVIEQTMPLFEAVDYSGDKIAQDDVTLPAPDQQEESAPWLFILNDEDNYVRLDKIAASGDLEPVTGSGTRDERWYGTVRVPRDKAGIRINIHGAPRHILDADVFDYLDDDEPLQGGWDYATIEVTCSIKADYWCEAAEPDALPTGISAPMRKVIWAGEGHQKVYVAKDTVVGVDESGSLVTSDGGFVRDDSDRLKATAVIAGEWYLNDHYVLQMTTRRMKPTSEISIGSLVTEIGDILAVGGNRETINSPITEIRMSTPIMTGGEIAEASMTVTTWAGELDAMLLLPPHVDPAVTPSEIHSFGMVSRDRSQVGATLSQRDRSAMGL